MDPKRILLSLAFIVGVLLLVIYWHPGANPYAGTAGPQGGIPPGFFEGLVHGFIAPLVFWVSLVNQDFNIYAIYNNGGWYNFGFLFGLSISVGGGLKSIAERIR